MELGPLTAMSGTPSPLKSGDDARVGQIDGRAKGAVALIDVDFDRLVVLFPNADDVRLAVAVQVSNDVGLNWESVEIAHRPERDAE